MSDFKLCEFLIMCDFKFEVTYHKEKTVKLNIMLKIPFILIRYQFFILCDWSMVSNTTVFLHAVDAVGVRIRSKSVNRVSVLC